MPKAESHSFVLPRMVVALREKAGLNQTQLAARLEVSPSAVNQTEAGDHGLQEGAFIRYTTKGTKAYDKEFSDALRKLRPHWFNPGLVETPAPPPPPPKSGYVYPQSRLMKSRLKTRDAR